MVVEKPHEVLERERADDGDIDVSRRNRSKQQKGKF